MRFKIGLRYLGEGGYRHRAFEPTRGFSRENYFSKPYKLRRGVFDRSFLYRVWVKKSIGRVRSRELEICWVSRLQNAIIKEYTLNYSRIPNMI